jgi:uncharacterized protein (DUF736 family)
MTFKKLYKRYTYLTTIISKYGHVYCDAWRSEATGGKKYLSYRMMDWQTEWEDLYALLTHDHAEEFKKELELTKFHSTQTISFGDLCC